MKLLLKFNLVFVLIFALGVAATGYVSWRLLERNAREEIAQNARLLMDTAIAARGYTSKQVKPLLQTQMKYTFLPQSVPAYSATEVFNDLRKKHTEYGYKEAVVNPTNPRNRAVDWEADLITRFRNGKDVTELLGDRETPTGRSFYIARPLRVTAPDCLECHSTVDVAQRPCLSATGRTTASAGRSTTWWVRRSFPCRPPCRSNARPRPSRCSWDRSRRCSWPSASCST